MLRLRSFRLAAVLAALAGTGVTGCSGRDASGTETPPAGSPPAASDIPEVLATIGDEQVTMADVRQQAGERLEQLETQYHKSRSQLVESSLQAILQERVLNAEAVKQGKTMDELVLAEAGGSFEPNEVEVAAWYQSNQDRVRGRTLEQLRPQIGGLLRAEKRNAALARLESRLNQDRDVTIHFQPWRMTFHNAGAPTAGKSGAAVTVVEFSDFQCPFCGRFVPTLQRIKQDFGDRVEVVYRQFPLTSIHPNAFKAAEASLCANEQGKFWEMHDMMFAEQDRLSVRELKAMPGRLGMKQSDFDACLDSGRYVEQVQNDLAEGNRAGITGTPAVFVNGVELPGGAVSYEEVAKAIEKELARP
ncbi:MAG TPA: DsbA family protein [Gemmatimonadales bacterium]|nr:DsbA family protein [Gemmatimonadales bacterium]